MTFAASSQLHPPHLILLVEDDAADATLICDAFAQVDVKHDFQVLPDGEQALAYLKRYEQGGARRPDLVILDLGLPRQSGFDVLAYLKGNAQLSSIPVLVLTGSQQDRDVWQSYQQHANAYVVKRGDAEEFRAVLHRLAEFYLQIVLLPSTRSA